MAVVTILGAGVMGTAMALPAFDREHQVRLVGTHLDRDIIDEVAGGGVHPRLKVVPPVTVARHFERLAETLATDTDVVVLGVSSAGVGWAIERLALSLRKPVPVVMITKGLDGDGRTIRVLPDVVASELQRQLGFAVPVAAIGGPCIAGELAARRQTGVVVTSRTPGLAQVLADMLSTAYYQPRISDDVIGVEVCAALKNFYAIAVGWANGQLEKAGPAANGALNHNPAAILFAQAVMEMAEIVGALGGDPATAAGMPGAGDLYVTCQAGRNSRLGRHLGAGHSYGDVKSGPMLGETIEGAELGIALAPTLASMMSSGSLDRGRLPLMSALLAALTTGRPLEPDWLRLHGVAA